MTVAFADTFFWVALANPQDDWHDPAKRVGAALGRVRLLTTDEVLAELLTFLSDRGPALRKAAVALVRKVQANPNVTVLPQTRASFESGLRLYADRLDRHYSLVDCISMETMRERRITDVLTHDHHFEQEGFTILLKDAA